MLKFKNMTTKENFLQHVEWSGKKVEQIEAYEKDQRAWQISDRFGNVWNVLFKGSVNEWSVFNVPQYGEPPFKVDIVSCGNDIEIHRAEKAGRKIESDRLLKQFSQLAMMVNCYIQFNYLKI